MSIIAGALYIIDCQGRRLKFKVTCRTRRRKPFWLCMHVSKARSTEKQTWTWNSKYVTRWSVQPRKRF